MAEDNLKLTGNAPPEAVLRQHQQASPYIGIDTSAGPLREAIETRVVEQLVGSKPEPLSQLYYLLLSMRPGEAQVIKTLNPRQLEVLKGWALHGFLTAIKVVTPQPPTAEQQLTTALMNTQKAFMALIRKMTLTAADRELIKRALKLAADTSTGYIDGDLEGAVNDAITALTERAATNLTDTEFAAVGPTCRLDAARDEHMGLISYKVVDEPADFQYSEKDGETTDREP